VQVSKQFVDRTNHLGKRLSDQGDRLRFVDGEGGCLAAAEANVNGDFIGLDERDVFDEQGHHALALRPASHDPSLSLISPFFSYFPCQTLVTNGNY
jgi:hypothetical protein